MKSNWMSSLIVALTCSVACAQQGSVHALLPEGSWTADVMTAFKGEEKMRPLLQKYAEALQRNRDWYVAYLKEHRDRKPIPYHPNFGLTEQEYREIGEYATSAEMIAGSQITIRVIPEGNVIRLYTEDDSPISPAINVTVINLEEDAVYLADIKLAYRKEVNVTTDKNALKSKWHGREWAYQDPADLDEGNFSLDGLNAESYRFLLGRRESDGATMLQYKIQRVKNGQAVSQMDIPVMLKVRP